MRITFDSTPRSVVLVPLWQKQNGFGSDTSLRCFRNHHFIITPFIMSVIITSCRVPVVLFVGESHGDKIDATPDRFLFGGAHCGPSPYRFFLGQKNTGQTQSVHPLASLVKRCDVDFVFAQERRCSWISVLQQGLVRVQTGTKPFDRSERRPACVLTKGTKRFSHGCQRSSLRASTHPTRSQNFPLRGIMHH